jgi:hypothetical protein
MTVTPTATSGFLSGAGLWSLFWTMLFKIELIAKYLGCKGLVSRDAIFNWVRYNKALTLIMTEVANLMMHLKALSSPNLMTFVLGGTVANMAWIFGIIPTFQSLFGHRKVIE